jgi:anti-anti-sigma factor
MPLHVRHERGVAILSNLGRAMNDPRYASATHVVRALAEEGQRAFVVELAEVRDAGPPLLGLLVSITRAARNAGGQVVLARVGPSLRRILEEMGLEDYWDVYPTVEQAIASFTRPEL